MTALPRQSEGGESAGEGTFSTFIRRIRQGDAQAAEELVRHYEPAIRMEIRMRLTDPRLYRVVDSMDICQSVLSSFFVRAASGQYDLERPEQLLKLLVAIAQNKVAFQARRQRAQRRDQRREVGIDAGEGDVATPSPSPSRLVASKDLLQAFLSRLSEDERKLADRRARGCEWAEIAAELGGTAQARRKQLARAADRVAQELGIDDVD
jgi:RNA polymerase sigma-70 factor (ECF subfamily)